MNPSPLHAYVPLCRSGRARPSSEAPGRNIWYAHTASAIASEDEHRSVQRDGTPHPTRRPGTCACTSSTPTCSTWIPCRLAWSPACPSVRTAPTAPGSSSTSTQRQDRTRYGSPSCGRTARPEGIPVRFGGPSGGRSPSARRRASAARGPGRRTSRGAAGRAGTARRWAPGRAPRPVDGARASAPANRAAPRSPASQGSVTRTIDAVDDVGEDLAPEVRPRAARRRAGCRRAGCPTNFSAASSSQPALRATPSSTARVRCPRVVPSPNVVEAGAGVAVVDRRALAGEPRREDHAAGPGRRGGRLGRAGRRSRASGATASRHHCRLRPADSWLLASRYDALSRPGTRWPACRSRSVFLRGTGALIQAVVLIDTCGSPEPDRARADGGGVQVGQAGDGDGGSREAEVRGHRRPTPCRRPTRSARSGGSREASTPAVRTSTSS